MEEDPSQAWSRNETLRGFRLLEVLSHGRSGNVAIAVDSKGRRVVVKTMSKRSFRQHWVNNETRAGLLLRKKSLVKFRAHMEDDLNNYIVLEYVKGEDLWHFMSQRGWKPLCEKDARKVFTGVVRSVEYCHDMGVAHKDIKLENVMIDSKLKTTLIDFGFCEFAFFTKLSTRFDGTLDYMPPEMLRRHPFNPYKADIYALGTLLYILVAGFFPFDMEQRWKMVGSGVAPYVDWTLPDIPELSPFVKDLVDKMMDPSAERRISMAGVVSHPWMRVLLAVDLR